MRLGNIIHIVILSTVMLTIFPSIINFVEVGVNESVSNISDGGSALQTVGNFNYPALLILFFALGIAGVAMVVSVSGISRVGGLDTTNFEDVKYVKKLKQKPNKIVPLPITPPESKIIKPQGWWARFFESIRREK